MLDSSTPSANDAPLAQLVERKTVNLEVTSSILVRCVSFSQRYTWSKIRLQPVEIAP